MDRSTRIALAVAGIGCLGLSCLCCIGVGAGVGVPMQQRRAGADAYASRFLGALQAHDTATAFRTSEYMGDTSLYSLPQFQTCFGSTVLGDMTSFTCDPANVVPLDDDTEVVCHVTSATHGAADITLDVNSPDDTPYLGFVWFAPGVWMGPMWHGDDCARWSGREYFREPPAGRIRP